MKNKFLIALDMDGTLLNDKKKICLRTKLYLRKIAKKGHIVVIASGRPFRAIEKYYNSLKNKYPIVCYNGAYIHSPHDSNFKSRHFCFNKEIVKEIFKSVYPKYVLNCMCETNDDIWLVEDDQKLDKFFWYSGMNIHRGEIDKTLDENPWTMILKMKDESCADEIHKQVNKHKGYLFRTWGKSIYSEIYFDGVNKWSSIKTIADYYCIPRERIIAFGDASNDIHLVHEAGIGVAMLNGQEGIKEAANIITKKDNNHNGIKHTLKKLLK